MLALFDDDDAFIATWKYIETHFRFGLWSWDINPDTGDWSRGIFGRDMEWSWGFYDLLGIEPLSVPTTFGSLEEHIHPDDKHQAKQIEAAIHAGGRFEISFRALRPKGIMRRLKLYGESLHNERGIATKATGILKDVTERQTTEQALKEAQSKFSALVGALRHPVRIARADGGTIDMLGWEEVTGQKASEALGFGWLQKIHPDDRGQTRAALLTSADRSMPFDIEHRIETKDGYRWFRSSALAPFRFSDLPDAPPCRVAVDVDIHDTKLARAQDAGVLTGAQIRSARGLLRWSVRDLAEAAKLSPATVRRLEESDGPISLPPGDAEQLRRVLRDAGAEFSILPGGKPGVSPRTGGVSPR